eukprot:3200149-Prymnesium_polylepis.1
MMRRLAVSSATGLCGASNTRAYGCMVRRKAVSSATRLCGAYVWHEVQRVTHTGRSYSLALLAYGLWCAPYVRKAVLERYAALRCLLHEVHDDERSNR